jgi:nucleoid DNA-binding protein
MAKATGAKRPKSMSKSEMLADLAEKAELSKKEVAGVLEALSEVISENVGKKGPGIFVLPGLLKIRVIKKDAQPARKGVPNPFRPGELMDVPAKPARKVVKVQPLKALKAMV